MLVIDYNSSDLTIRRMVFFNYVDWTLENPPRAFYVGKGKLKRTQQRERNVYWKNIAAKHGWRREVVLATKDESFAFNEERRRIAELGTFEDGTPGRWGANLTEGGEGVSGRYGQLNAFFGHKHSLESRVKMSGENHPHYGKRGKTHPNFGKQRTGETRKRISEAGKGRKDSIDTRLKKGGENNPRAALNWERVDAIRARYSQGGVTCKELAIEHGVKTHAIWRVVNLQTWTLRPSTSESE